MKTIVNKTSRPLKIKLSQGRVLRLGPAKEGQIATHDAERESMRKLVEAEEVDIFDNASATGSRIEKGPGGFLQGQGRQRQVGGSRRGDR